jgi:double-stranded uracil-DNA glycosylase
MSPIYCFPPISDPNARVLILGSMPGQASLDAQQYYAHPRNLFWRIFGALIGAGVEAPYGSRIQLLKTHGIAVWDVLNSCVREGSLDSNIENASMTLNDFAAFYRSHSNIARVFFNGGKAEEVYTKQVLLSLPSEFSSMQYYRLPSTSPAHASLSFEEKLRIWRVVVE